MKIISDFVNKKNTCACEHHSSTAEQRPADSTANHSAEHHQSAAKGWQLFTPSIICLALLLTALILDHILQPKWFDGTLRFCCYAAAYLIVGLPVLRDAIKSIIQGDIFSEFLLMSIATMGAIFLGEYPEAVAVMLFYAVGETFQSLAVKRAKGNIKSLLDQRPDQLTLIENGQRRTIAAQSAPIGGIILLKPGEKLALDGVLSSPLASFNTAALTGESIPQKKKQGDTVLAGMVNLDTPAQVRITTAYQDSKLSKILELVENASAQKAPTELFIRKFAKIYTPIIVLLAALICLLPALIFSEYIFSDWLYRAMVFLVISCPCALVISIPLGYFGGIGAASKNGILVKGSNYLDTIAKIKHIVLDKTGTLTEGKFQVREVNFTPQVDQPYILNLVNLLEQQSSHPIASAIKSYLGPISTPMIIQDMQEIAGKGLKARIDGQEILVGNIKLLETYGVSCPDSLTSNPIYTLIHIALQGQYIGYISIYDAIKADAAAAIKQLHALNIKTTILSGDKNSVVSSVAQELHIDYAYGEMLPQDKVDKLKQIKTENQPVAFVGDGMNDAPVLAISDVGIAMGGLGSDAAIETANIVIQDDKPSKIPAAIYIGKKTKEIVWQNIILAFGIKAIVLILGATGLASMWEAVFADVGVALLAILNAIRIQKIRL